MINTRIDQATKTVYVDVSGYITTKEANEFLNKHRQMTKGMKKSQYKLVVTPSQFECENDSDIKSVCIGLYKGGYKQIYMVDPKGYIMNTVALSSMEQKVFTKVAKFVKSINDIK
ncbi:hypothetical protein [Romboutsia sp. 13368]|uniref:hypothetical protein n=1 Tax=Romboutsia sp. 13368 TaxID=2708053 RepID=UPI0025D6E7E1|nr:hypothetical protein [Romboutsia sp. 13368]